MENERDQTVAREQAARAAEEAAQQQLTTFLERITDAFVSLDTEWRYTYVNERAGQLFNRRPEDLIGKHIWTEFPEGIGQPFYHAYYKAVAEQTPIQLEDYYPPWDRWFENRIYPSKSGLTIFFQDITVRKLAEIRLATQHAVTLVLAEATSLAEATPKLLQTICTRMGWDVGVIWTVDETAQMLRCIDVWYRPTIDASAFAADTRARTFGRGLGMPGRVWASGEPTWVCDVTKAPHFLRAPAASHDGLHGGVAFALHVARTITGMVELFSRKIREPNYAELQMLGDLGSQIGQFIERKRLEEQFRQTQKMEAIGQLAGGIAHDFNNLLTVINGYSEIMLQNRNLDALQRSNLEQINKAGQRAASLTGQLLAFSRRQVLAPKVLDLNAVVTNIEQMLRRLIGENIDLVTILKPELGRVKADPGQIELIIMNLSVNARDAMPRGGTLTVETANVTLDGTNAGQQVVVQAGPYAMLAVSDTGTGMDADTQTHIFEPFFTTKEQGKGTGLGLATVYGIVKQSGGTISVDSALGQGTTVRIYLPRVEDMTETDKLDVARTKSARGTETILLAEDEAGVRSVECTILREAGYKVLEAANAREALEKSATHAGPLHLLVTDVVMPGMSGPELAERLRTFRPDLKVLYVSGYTKDAIGLHGVLDEKTSFLPKPFSPNSLVYKVREVLDAGIGKE